MSQEFDLPTEVFFGEGCSSEAGQCTSRHGRKALLVTGRSSARSSGALARVLPSLEAAGVEVSIFDAVEPNPTTKTVSDGAAHAKNYKADVIVGIGGGSPLDAAKGIAILATNDGPPQKYFGEEPSNEPLPVIAVPTTSGTGSEVTPYAIITDISGDIEAKRTMRSLSIFPKAALVDPELTYSMPPTVTADTGMDALSHAVEGCLCTKRSIATNFIAMESIRLILRHLRQAYDMPRDADARSGMCHAALLAGTVISQTGTELIHSMGYRLTLRYGVPHGRANAMVMPAVVRLYSPCEPVGWMCKALGGKWVPDRRTERSIAGEISELARDVGIDMSLRVDVSDDELDALADGVVSEERKMANCFRRPTRDEVRTIFVEALRMDCDDVRQDKYT